MIRYILLQIKRLVVLALVMGLAWFTVFAFFPAVEQHVPLLLAVVITYCFVAYFGIPAILRVRYLGNRPQRVPTRASTADGWSLDPINIVVAAKTERDFIWAMEKSGWRLADPPTLINNFKFIVALLLERSYATAPFGRLYVFGRRQDLGFEIQLNGSPRHRHHVRFWRLTTTILDDDHEHHGFWQKLLRKFVPPTQQIWVGAAILDRGLNIQRRNFQITHRVDANTNLERDFVVNSLKKAFVLRGVTDIKAGEPLHARHQSFGETIITDGYVKLCEIKRQVLPPPPN